LAAKGKPGLRRKVLEALASTVDAGVAAEIRTALGAGNLEAAVRAIPWGRGWAPDLTAAFTGELGPLAARAGRQAIVSAARDLRIALDAERLPLSLVNERAVAWAEGHAAARVVEIGRETRAGLRRFLADGIADGWSPMKLARTIRETVGLTEAQAGAVARFRRKLIADGLNPVGAAKYADKLLRVRAENIARTETQEAVNAGEAAGWEQAVTAGWLPPGQEAEWLTNRGDRTCDVCESLGGQRVAVGGSFQASNGETFERPPAHPSCRCARILVVEPVKKTAAGQAA